MKKSYFHLSLVLIAVLVMFSGCRKDEYDEDLLIGSWSTSTWSYVFHDNHTGSREQRGRRQDFTWRLDDDELELQFEGYEIGESEIVAFTVYIVKELKETRMEAYDRADDSKTIIIFTKK